MELIIMGICNSIEYIELDDIEPLPYIKPFKYEKLKEKKKNTNSKIIYIGSILMKCI